MERHRLKRQNRFARALHRFNVLLEPSRRAKGAELTATAYIDRQGRADLTYCVNTIDKRAYPVGAANTDSIVIAGKTGVADIDIITARSDIGTGGIPYGNVEDA